MLETPNQKAPLILPFDEIDGASLAVAGGKASNLGELVLAGFPVPPGFCVTTTAYDLVASQAGLETTLDALAGCRPEDTARLSEMASETRSLLGRAEMPEGLAQSIAEAYEGLGDGVPVAVRSSATAEDLPQASFAGQQDTYLNVVGAEALIDAVRRCWASLWTDRAVSYRATNGVDPHGVRLAVVVQRMVDASVAGVLFTANPVSGKRHQAVIDASPGLGEAVVSGMVNPDHFVVDTATEQIVERRLGDKRVAITAGPGGGTERVEHASGQDEACVTDREILALARLGARVEEHYGRPQDTEWAIDAEGKVWLPQARPITTLFPLPAGAPEDDKDLRVYFSFNVAQGVYRPLTPMGIQAFLKVAGVAASLISGQPVRGDGGGPSFVVEAGGRLFLDVTAALRGRTWRPVLDLAMRNVEARTAPILRDLSDDPRLYPIAINPRPVLRTLYSLAVRRRMPLRVAAAIARPRRGRRRAEDEVDRLRKARELPRDAGARRHLDAAERLLLEAPQGVLVNVGPNLLAGLVSNALSGRLLGGLATEDERRRVMGGLPHNPTTEMDLALWALARSAKEDPDSSRALREVSPERLAEEYIDGTLPPGLQTGLEEFLRLYGHRGVAEIDLGLPRWSEDPTYVLGILANYLRLEDPGLAPDVQFRRAAREAEATVAELSRRAASEGRLRGMLVGFLLGRARELLGYREMPKFCFVLLFSRVRGLLWRVGEELVEEGHLEDAGDIFFLDLSEARDGLGGRDLRPLVRERRAAYEGELGRRHVPRVLLSDGTEPVAEVHHASAADEGMLVGTPAGGGVVSAEARVILDPAGAVLEPGEILVAPSTDPGWTPLFLTAGGLVMEMGGPMSHGAIVAREYGIPAVVGVPDATELIGTGQWITVDGSSGEITPNQEGA